MEKNRKFLKSWKSAPSCQKPFLSYKQLLLTGKNMNWKALIWSDAWGGGPQAMVGGGVTGNGGGWATGEIFKKFKMCPHSLDTFWKFWFKFDGLSFAWNLILNW
jgi:hypothetical protein